mmetsp:Transcript_7772/g.32437  ORF Transcript_7772/g.32437 Transcript_7772/m.32437 type:complete len:286 (+) Transcript_7772:33-890(+)
MNNRNGCAYVASRAQSLGSPYPPPPGESMRRMSPAATDTEFFPPRLTTRRFVLSPSSSSSSSEEELSSSSRTNAAETSTEPSATPAASAIPPGTTDETKTSPSPTTSSLKPTNGTSTEEEAFFASSRRHFVSSPLTSPSVSPAPVSNNRDVNDRSATASERTRQGDVFGSTFSSSASASASSFLPDEFSPRVPGFSPLVLSDDPTPVLSDPERSAGTSTTAEYTPSRLPKDLNRSPGSRKKPGTYKKTRAPSSVPRRGRNANCDKPSSRRAKRQPVRPAPTPPSA